jgi:hypothetical protein
MRIDPLSIRPWVAGVAAALIFAVVFSVLIWVTSQQGERDFWPAEVIVGGLGGGALTAVAMGLSVRNLQRRLRPAVESLSPEAARAAYRAARHGPIPAQPEVRAAALDIAEHQLAGFVRVRIWLLLAGVCVVASQFALALDDDGFDWPRLLVAVGFAVAFGTLFLQPRLSWRRIAQLRG